MVSEQQKILIVEDDTFLMNLLSLKLRKEQFDVVQAFDGLEAMEKLKEIRPRLILLDLILPKKNGFEILQEIGQDPQMKTIPIIIISNLGQEADIERGKGLGAVEYFVKARLSIDDLIAKVKEFVAKA